MMAPEASYQTRKTLGRNLADAEAASAAERRRGAGEEYLPADVVDRLIAGEHPLRVWRQHRGMTLKVLATEAGVSIAHISDIERGEREGKLPLLRKLAAALSVDLDDILPQVLE